MSKIMACLYWNLMFFAEYSQFIIYKLFCSYCTSSFGCELWSLENRSLVCVSVAWRKALRKIWSLPKETHNYLLPIISNCIPIYNEIARRSHNFCFNCLNSPNNLTRFIACSSLSHGRGFSLIGRNASIFKEQYTLFLDRHCISLDNMNVYSDEQLSIGNTLLDLIKIRESVQQFSTPDFLGKCEISSLVTELCTA